MIEWKRFKTFLRSTKFQWHKFSKMFKQFITVNNLRIGTQLVCQKLSHDIISRMKVGGALLVL